MAEIDTKRIQVGPVTQQYVECLWLVEPASAGAQARRDEALEGDAIEPPGAAAPGGSGGGTAAGVTGAGLELGRVVARVLERRC